ncbi:hypothetical protein [Spiroplasma endosymbiont of Acasis viretata]|uniref:hypothetical protein n=1 Tax=Spiroplasma endosymbiont of Acasis viretata TaxID=3066306 RepID=UPI00313E0CC7
MKILLNFSKELTKSINNSSLNTIIEINNWTNPIQEHKNKLEEIYQNFLKSQELSKVLFNKSINTYKPHFINKMKREVLFIKINEEKKDINLQNINKLTTHEIQILTKKEVQRLTTEEIVILTPRQIQAFTEWQITWFTIEQIQILTKLQIQSLTKKQIESFTTLQISWFTKKTNIMIHKNTNYLT